MGFEISRLRPAERIVAAGAIALFVFMFCFSWLGASAAATALPGTSFTFSSSFTGWEAFTGSRWIWLATIVLALAMVVASAIGREAHGPLSLSALVAALGAVSTLLILYRIFNHAHGSIENHYAHASWGLKIGIWLGLLAAAAIAYGGYRALREDGVTVGSVQGNASDAT